MGIIAISPNFILYLCVYIQFLQSLGLLQLFSHANSCYWRGGSGFWSDSENWNPFGVPGSSCKVIIGNLSRADSLIIPSSTYSVQDLIITNTTLGKVYLMHNTTLNVINSFVMNGDELLGSSSNSSIIEVSNITLFHENNKSSRRILRSVKISQRTGQMLLEDVELVMNDAELYVDSSATLIMKPSATKTINLKNDVSRLYYDRYDESAFTNLINLHYAVPVENAVYDLVVSSVLRLNASLAHSMIESNSYTWPHAVQTDLHAQMYYAYHVGHWSPGDYKYDLYNRSIAAVDPDECAMICNLYAWCKSFDLYTPGRLCMLSAYYSKHVGGLSPNSSWVHFSQRYDVRQGESKVVANGNVIVVGGSYSQIFIGVDTDIAGVLQLNDSLVSFSRSLNVYGSVIFNGFSYLSMNFSLSSLNLQSSGLITSASGGSCSISFSGGSHVLSGTILGQPSIRLLNQASIDWNVTSTSSNRYSVVSLVNSSMISFSSNILIPIHIDKLEVNSNSRINGDALNITSNYTVIDVSSVISVSGNVQSVSHGISAGRSHNISPSGGSHGGLGGNGAVDVLGPSYDSVTFPVLPGSEGGACLLSSSSSAAGQGGGVIHLYSSILVLEGGIESNGNSGGSTCTGGGAGGSIAIRSVRFIGNGKLSARGGDGGFAGGSAAAGAGGGGRIALDVEKLSFNGSFDVSGGYRPTTASADVEDAGAGSLYVKACILGSNGGSDCTDIQAVVVADSPTSNYFSSLQSRQSNYGALVDEAPMNKLLNHEVLPRRRGSYVFESSSEFSASPPVDVHIIGSSPVIFRGKSIEIGNIIGSPSAAIIFENGITVLANQNNITLENCSIYVANATIAEDTEYLIGKNGRLILYNTNDFRFKSIILHDYGSLITLNQTMKIVGERLIFTSSGGILATNIAVELSIESVEIYKGLLTYTYASTMEKYKSPLNINWTSGSTFVNGELFVDPSISIDLHGKLIFNNGKLQDLSYASNNSILLGKSYENTHALLHIKSGGNVSVEYNSTAHVYSDVVMEDGDIYIDSFAKLYMRYRTTTCLNNHGISTRTGSSFIIDHSAIVNSQYCSEVFFGSGKVIVQRSGALYPSNVLPSTLTDIHVRNEGIVSFGNSSEFDIYSTLYIDAEGVMNLRNNTSVTIHQNVHMSASILKLDSQTSFLNVSGSLDVKSGLIYGPGYLTVHDNGVFVSTNDSSFIDTYYGETATYETKLLYSQLTILQTWIINYGSMTFRNDTVNYARGLRFHNFGSVVLHDSRWNTRQRLFAYRLYESYDPAYSYSGLPVSPTGHIYENITQISCAALCQNHNNLYARQVVSTQRFVDESYACVGFYYQQKLSICQLRSTRLALDVDKLSSIDLPDFERPTDASKDYLWDFYAIDATWAKESKIINEPSGSFESASNSLSNIVSITFQNDGTLSIPKQSSMTFSDTFCNSLSGSIIVNGTLLLTGSSLNKGAVDEPISSYMESLDGDVSSTSNHSSIISGFIGGDGNVELAGRLHYLVMTSFCAPDLNIVVSGQVQLLNVSSIDVFSLIVQPTGEFFLYNKPLELKTSSLILSGTIRTHDQVARSWQFYSGIGLNCSNCYDISINSTVFNVTATGIVSVASGIIITPSAIVDGKLSCSDRGFSSSEIFKLPYQISSALNISAWAGVYGLLGSSGGSHGGARGGIGFGYQYDVLSGVFSNKSQSVSFQDYPYQQVQYKRRMDIASSSYDGYYNFLSWGTPGGEWKSIDGGQGGGNLRIYSSDVTINGELSCDGQSISESLAGGGSGGSLMIVAQTLSGNGLISANGGQGGFEANDPLVQAGGGSGGRVIIVVNNIDSFIGEIAASGGDGFEDGSPGTVTFFENTENYGNSLLLTTLDELSSDPNIVIDGRTSIYSTATYFTQSDLALGLISSMQVLNAAVRISLHGEKLHINDFISDGSGSVYITNSIVVANINATLALEFISIYFEDNANAVLSHLFLQNMTSFRISETGSIADSIQGLSTGNYTFNSLNIASNSSLVVAYLQNFDSSIYLNVTDVDISFGSRLTSNGQGLRIPSSNVQGGAGHGGKGGQSMTGQGETEYGNVTFPNTFGRAGGSTIYGSTGGGAGGGIIRLEVQRLSLDGKILANGDDAYTAGASGGSGGSIYLSVTYLEGSGSIEANGGHGLYSKAYFGGGGSGGRIAIFCFSCTTDDQAFWSNIVNGQQVLLQPAFIGSVLAQGGHSIYRADEDPQVRALEIGDGYALDEWLNTNPYTASSGTVFLSLNSTTALLLDNSKFLGYNESYEYVNQYGIYSISSETYRLSPSTTSLTSYPTALQFDRLYISRYARLAVENGLLLNITGYFDDGTGEIIISTDGTLHLPSSFDLSSGNITLYGSMIGATDMTLSNFSTMTVFPSAVWNASFNHTFTSENRTGLVNISNLTLKESSSVLIAGGTQYALYPKITIYCRSLNISGSSSTLSASGQGYTAQGLGGAILLPNQTTSLYQANSNVSNADGGWHAGRGGGRLIQSFSSGNAYQPLEWGRAGGSTYMDIGTSGGGTIHVIASNFIYNDGVISSNGDDCLNTESTAGTGAGGSVWLHVVEGVLTGNGIIEANGGNGCQIGGGSGSGGRIAVWDVSRASNYSGSYSARSGSQVQSSFLTYPPSGGTVFSAFPDGSSGLLAATNHGQGGSSISIHGSNVELLSNFSTVDKLESIYLYDANVTLPPQSLTVADSVDSLDLSVIPLSGMSAVPTSSNCFTSTLGRLIARNMAVLVLGNITHAFIDRDMDFVNSALLYRGNITLSSTLVMSPTSSCSRRISSADYTEITQGTNLSSFLSSSCPVMMNTPFSSSISNDIFNELTYDHLTIQRGASLRFSPVTDQKYLNSSLMITASAIKVENGGILDGSNILQIIDNSLGIAAASTTGASGGGHAGYGEKGYSATKASAYRGDVFLPFGFGQGGGIGQASGEDGGSGGMGLLVHAHQLILDGIITVNGGTPAMGTAAGGGAGGSLMIIASSLEGNGTLSANGGHGSISAQSLVHGGSGSGGRISLFYCNHDHASSFSGKITARGGFTMLSQSNFTNLYDSTSRSFRSMQRITAAAAGTIITYNVSDKDMCERAVLSNGGIDLASLSTMSSEPELDIISWSDTNINDLVKLSISNLSPTVCNASVDVLALAAAVDSLEMSSLTASSAVTVNTSPTILALASGMSFSSLSLVNASLELRGSGSFKLASLLSEQASSLSFYDNTSFVANNTSFILNDVSLTFNDCSRFTQDSDLSLIVGSDSTIYFFNGQSCSGDQVIVHTTNDSVLSSQSSQDYIKLNQSYSLFVHDLAIRDNSHIHGSTIAIRAKSLSIEHGSSVNADGAGYSGGTVINSKPTSGQGFGGGGAEEAGANGGAYGGDGGLGISALSRLSLYDYTHRNTGEAASSIDLSALLSTNQLGYLYGDFRYPIWPGSGGGSIPGMSNRTRGGNGGGIIILNITSDIFIDSDSRISADGESVFDGSGAGAGGSIYLARSTGSVTGSGRISAMGGNTCKPSSNCSTSIQYPGGYGGGGRMRFDRDMSSFAGSISAVSGASASSFDSMLNRYHGTVVNPTVGVSLKKTASSYLDIIFPDPTRRIIQVISTSGFGDGDRNNTDSFYAIVKGSWELGYRSNHARTLPSQATAFEVQQVLESFSELKHVNVARRENQFNGWDWIITFFDNLPTSEMLSVTGNDLYTSSKMTLNNTASIMIRLIHWSTDEYVSYANITSSSFPDSNNAFSNYSTTEIESFVGFNMNITDSQSYAHWIDLSTYRIATSSSFDLNNSASTLRCAYLGQVPTNQGWSSGLNSASVSISGS